MSAMKCERAGVRRHPSQQGGHFTPRRGVMRRGLKREDLIEDPAELVALPNMVPVYAVIRPHALMCFIVLGILGTLVIGGAYDVIFWSAGSRNVLTDTVLGPEVLQGEPAQIVFGNDTEPLSPYMRWLRVSMVLYPKAREEAGCGLYNMTERCRMPVPSNLVLRSAILYRQADNEPWRLSKKSSDAELDPIECPKRTSKTSHPHHPGWPDGSRDPLDRGHHSHCYVFSVAYEPGLEHKQFAAQLTLATQPGKDSPADYPPPSEWIDSIVLVSTHGTIEHGYSELCLRLLALVTSLVSFGLFTRQLWRHPLRDWLPQQYAIWIFSLAICGYNNPSFIIMMPLGLGYTVVPAIFDIAFYAAGMMLATVLAASTKVSMANLPQYYWVKRIALAGLIWVVSTLQYGISDQHKRSDPSFTYKLEGAFLVFAVLEFILLGAWALFVALLIFRQVRTHEDRLKAQVQELAFASITAIVVAALWGREAITFRVYSQDFMSDVSFKYRARTVIMCNVLSRLIAALYAPSDASQMLRAHGSLDAMMLHLIGRDGGMAAGGGAGSAAPAPAPESAADAVRQYVEYLQRAHRSGPSNALKKSERAHYEQLRRVLESMPQTRAYTRRMAWVYPELAFASEQPYLWAIVLRDLDDPVVARRTHARLGGAGSKPGARAVAAVLKELKEVGLHVSAHRAPLGARSDGHAYVVLVHDLESKVAIENEYESHYGERLMVEESLDPEPPAMTTADKIASVARLVTERAELGPPYAALGACTYKAHGVEIVEASFPLHDREFNRKLEKAWGIMAELSEAHLNLLRNHFGEELAWYFGLLDFTVEWLFPVAAAGFCIELVKLGGDVVLYNSLWVAFGSALALWGALFVVFWRRRSAELRNDWGVDGLHKNERRNPAFTGKWRKDAETLLEKPRYTNWNRMPAFGNTALQMLLQVLLLTGIEYISYAQYVWACERYDGVPGQEMMYYFQTYILNTAIYVGCIMFGQYVLWSYVAAWCTRREQWPFQEQFDRQYVYYLFVFIWLDGYFWSWFFGYIHIPLVDSGVDLRQWEFPLFGKLIQHERDADYWMAKHDTMVASMLGMNQVAAFTFENVWPLILVSIVRRRAHARRAKSASMDPKAYSKAKPAEREAQERETVHSFNPRELSTHREPAEEDTARVVLQALDELALPSYSTQDDYYDVVLFIGYIATYTVVWPLTPVACYLNNQLELRTDLIKINNAFRRMVPKKAKSVGAWDDCIVFSVWAAIPMIVTFATISSRTAEIFFLHSEDPEHPQHDRFWNADGHVKWWWRVVVCFVWEHLLALGCLIIYSIVPEKPKWIKEVQKAQRIKLANTAHHDAIQRIRARESKDAEARATDESPKGSRARTWGLRSRGQPQRVAS